MLTSTPTAVDEPTNRRHELSSKRILAECCEQRAVCKIQLIPSDVVLPARFGSFRVEELELGILQEPVTTHIRTQSICCVSFPHGTSFCAFLGCVTAVSKSVLGERTLVATVPQHLTVTNLRQSFRVPVIEDAGLETALRTADHQRSAVWTRDITEGGLEIELRSDGDLELQVGSSVTVEMTFRGELVERVAEVRRIAGSQCALAFVRSTDSDGQRQSARTHAMVLSLQKLWLKSRLI